MATTLFSPVRFGAFERMHRVAMAPLTRRRADTNGIPHELSVDYYVQRASASLIVAEATAICPLGIGAPGAPGIYSEDHINAWKKVTDAVHASGGLIFLQLWHAGRMSHPMINGGHHPIAPSPVRAEHPEIPFLCPQEMSLQDIRNVIDDYQKAAANARRAGFDGIELHAANGYLIDQFLQTKTNQRQDSYGGDQRNRFRFLAEILDAILPIWGEGKVGIRLSPGNSYNSIGDLDPQALFSYVVKELNAYPLSYLHLIEPRIQGDQDASTAMATALSAKAFRPLYNGTLIAAGGYQHDSAQAAIQNGEADIIAFGRCFISNPDLPLRLQNRWPLTPYDRSTFYEGGVRGYTDYTTYR